MTILIQNGQVINPATGMNEVADVLVENGVVSKIEKGIKEKADRKINAKGCFVMPGFIDMHVHLRDPGFEEKETIETGCRAAAHGGYTTILAMPNTKPVVDNPDVVNYVHNKAKTVGLVNVLQVGAVTKNQEGKELADIEGMVKAGIPAISEDGKSVMNAQLYREAMEKAAKLGIVVLAHCEDKNLVNGGVMNEDEHARELGLKGITNSVEDIIVARDIMLSHDTGAKLHLCHCSTEDSVMMVDLAKQKNVKVTIKNKRGGSSRNTRTTQTKRKRRSALSAGGDAVSSAASTAGTVVGKSVKTAGNLLFTGLHWLCALLMLGIVLQIFRNVFNYTSIGAIMELPSSRDINGIIFVGGSAFFILFGIIEALWILGSKKVMDMGVLRNIDTGRGIFAFGLFLIITIFAPFIDGFLSLGYNGIEGEGGRWILDAFTGSKTILTFAAAGLILSFVRKMRGSIRGMIA